LKIEKRKLKIMITKISKLLFACLVCCGATVALSGCSDMLETESTRQNFDPSIGEKTDSLVYAFGIFQAMQQLADQYVLQGEMRGDLLETSTYTDSNLRRLADFTATTTNKYDSAYVYYRVINNCNYYITHRNTELYSGATNVAINEYAAVKAIRAWAYLQLARNYGTVPFFTEPLTQISQIEDGQFPELDINGIVAELAPDLEPYVALPVPSAHTGSPEIGKTNWNQTKTMKPSLCFMPVSVVLGDLYLEAGNYASAARCFVTYLTKVASASSVSTRFVATMTSKNANVSTFEDSELPSADQIQELRGLTNWVNTFSANATQDIITYIPMAVTAQNGTITNLPLYFGADYYATPAEQTGYRRSGSRLPLVQEIQVKPSEVLNTLSDSTDYYYYVNTGSGSNYDSIQSCKAGDMRLRNVLDQQTVDGEDLVWITKYDNANIILYRNTTVLLHLAEAFNRMGLCDAAFAILKEREAGASDAAPYMTESTKKLLRESADYALLKDSFLTRFSEENACGVHCHGAGKAVSDLAIALYQQGKSPYTYDAVIGKKMEKIAEEFGVTVGTTKQDTINAIEDLLCDEYALEFAFEGNRFYDLCRLARHKNSAGADAHQGEVLYDPNFGNKWIARKLAFKGAAKVSEASSDWWYLPFK